MTKPATITASAGITTVAAVAMVAAATTTTIRFSLWQIAGHSFLPPTATATTTTTSPSTAFPFTIILR